MEKEVLIKAIKEELTYFSEKHQETIFDIVFNALYSMTNEELLSICEKIGIENVENR